MQNPPIDGKFPDITFFNLVPISIHEQSIRTARSGEEDSIESENERSPERTPELGGEVEEDELPVKYLVGVDVRWPASWRRKLQRDLGNANLSGRLVPQLGNLTNLLYL
ncbi:hypothetical protein U1Q18_033716 [Sarracenia purpurea var. burkii]